MAECFKAMEEHAGELNQKNYSKEHDKHETNWLQLQKVLVDLNLEQQIT